MQFVCDAPVNKTWFRIETESEAARDSDAMGHAVEKHFRRAVDAANQTYVPSSSVYIEQDIGRPAHLRRVMPLFLTLRDAEGTTLATAMLPPGGLPDPSFGIVIVGPGNQDPYPEHGAAIAALGEHYGLTLDSDRCYPYRSIRPRAGS